MPIPPNITRNHILRALQRIDNEINNATLPVNRLSRKYFLRYNNTDYPPKLVISYANAFPNGEELSPDPKVFTTYLAQDYLEEKEFEIISLPNAERHRN